MWLCCGSNRSTLVLAPEMLDRPSVAFGRPAGPGLPQARRSGWARRCNRRGHRHQILHQDVGAFGGAPALGKGRNLENPHGPIKRHRYDIPQPHGAARSVDAPAIDPDMAGRRKGRSSRARAHHTGMPEPLVYTLTIQLRRVLSPLLGVGLELLLERRELRKGRIGIGRLVAALPNLAAAL